jgi:hypothetical protein
MTKISQLNPLLPSKSMQIDILKPLLDSQLEDHIKYATYDWRFELLLKIKGYSIVQDLKI